MALTLEDIYSQLSGLVGNGNQGNGVSTFAQPGNIDSLNGLVANGQTYNNGGSTLNQQTNTNGLGLNIGTGQLALGGLGALSGIWGAYNSNKLANDQLKFTKDITNTNLTNQIKSYNTSLQDRITARAAVQGNDSAYVDDYLNKNRLTR